MQNLRIRAPISAIQEKKRKRFSSQSHRVSIPTKVKVITDQWVSEWVRHGVRGELFSLFCDQLQKLNANEPEPNHIRKKNTTQKNLSLLCESVCVCVWNVVVRWRTPCAERHCVRPCLLCVCPSVYVLLSWMSRCMKAFETDILSQSKDGLQWKSERKKEREHSFTTDSSPPLHPPPSPTHPPSPCPSQPLSLPPLRLARINDFTLNGTPTFTHSHTHLRNNTHETPPRELCDLISTSKR